MVMNGSLVEYFKQTERGINFLDIGASGGPDPKWEPLFNFLLITQHLNLIRTLTRKYSSNLKTNLSTLKFMISPYLISTVIRPFI